MNIYKLTYNVIGTLGGVISSPFWLFYVLARHKYRSSFVFRAGKISQTQKKQLQDRPNIWVHAVSVGEFLLADTVIKKLKANHPNYQIVVSVTTITGYAVALQKLDKDDQLIYFPLEFYAIMKRMVKIVQPKLAIITETEIWPNFIYSLAEDKVPVMLMNGRISEKSFKHYKMGKPFIKDVLENITSFQMQNREAFDRIIALGAPKNAVHLSGNIKFDSLEVATDPQPDQDLLDDLKLPAGTPLLIMAALEKLGREDTVALDVLAQVRKTIPEMGMIIVPRHPERGSDIAKLVRSRGFQSRKRSKGDVFDNPTQQIFILDTVGELKRFYSLAKIVFVGKSLFAPGGGQNMIEPICLGKPTLYGPYTRNFRGIADQIAKHDGAQIVASSAELASAVCSLYHNPTQATEMVLKGQDFIRQNQGATLRTLKAIDNLIKDR